MASLRTGRRRPLSLAAGVLAVTAIVLFLVAGTGSATGNKAGSSRAVVKGGTASMAFPPSAVPNYIFPFMSLAFFSVYNISNLQQLMYRPLYWFGNGSDPTLNPSLSLASKPVYSKGNTVVSFTLKPYKWSNGETVTAQQVVFWMNMLKVEYLGWAAYALGRDARRREVGRRQEPDEGHDHAHRPDQPVLVHLQRALADHAVPDGVGHLGNRPEARERGLRDRVLCSREDGEEHEGHGRHAGLRRRQVVPRRVRLSSRRQSGFDPANPKAPNNSLKTYATNPIWQVVNGPWHLTKFTSAGYVAMAPNKSYSGPVKPKLDSFVQLPFTSSAAEFNALVGGKITVGYLPAEDITSPAKSPLEPGKNNPRLSNFKLDPWYAWGINYFPYNFNSTGNGGQAGKIFRQLYFRQAFQTAGRPAALPREAEQELRRADVRAGAGPPEELVLDEVRVPESVPVQPEEGDRAAHLARLEGRPEGRHELYRRGEVRRAGRHEAPVHPSVCERLGWPRSS